jgi:hypothetical protein
VALALAVFGSTMSMAANVSLAARLGRVELSWLRLFGFDFSLLRFCEAILLPLVKRRKQVRWDLYSRLCVGLVFPTVFGTEAKDPTSSLIIGAFYV